MTSPRPGDLVTDEARALMATLAALPDTADPGALAAVRRAHPQADPRLVGALATQVRLRRRARDRLGPWAEEFVLDEEALQQATRRDVARYRAAEMAARLRPKGDDRPVRVADLGCGLGVDARALAEAGFAVLAVEQDPWRAEAAEVNLAALSDQVSVICGDATSLDASTIDSCDAAYVDPARRLTGGPRRADGGRSRAVADPAGWSPPWPWVVSLTERMPVVAKVAPGFDARLAPAGADIAWIDDRGETVEASVWMGRIGRGMRRAVALAGERSEALEAPRDKVPQAGPATSRVARLLLEPSPCVDRAGLIGDLAEAMRAPRLDAGTWLTADATRPTLLARPWRVVEEVPHGARDLRAWLRGRGSVTWKTADAQVSAVDWDARVGHRPARGGGAVTVVVTGQGRAFAVERAADSDAL